MKLDNANDRDSYQILTPETELDCLLLKEMAAQFTTTNNDMLYHAYLVSLSPAQEHPEIEKIRLAELERGVKICAAQSTVYFRPGRAYGEILFTNIYGRHPEDIEDARLCWYTNGHYIHYGVSER